MKSICRTSDAGDQYWTLPNGDYHREDGPAVIEGNYREWWLNGKLHRVDGAAIEYENGNKAWFLNGIGVDPLVHFILRGKISIDNS